MNRVDNLQISLPDQGGAPPVLGIFAKEPVPGKVKTRLSPPLSAVEAAALYRVSLEETLSSMGVTSALLVIFYDGSETFFRAAFPGVALICQGEGDLGDRLDRAFRTLFDKGVAAAAIIGSDSPDLPPALAEEAFAALHQHDCVIAPSRDGGYVLVGQRRHHPELFRNICWSSSRVLEQTRQNAAEVPISYRELGSWEDIDDLPSLRRFVERSPHSATARFAVTHNLVEAP